ncbi:hypothetical protein O6H91_01G055900 [Diphasiastrum complanatum]|uniref:Uncharacterized protein n=1 Tax=Diphasiastrum complanatum TaxID=34168 RepID=A0ACC2ERE1_DIPCM|nr:hypothetical protein O6H91_01G055900 [Diphasiastrum complanatum]
MAKTRKRKPLEPKDLNIIASKTNTSTYVVIEDDEEDVSVKKEQQLEQAKRVFEAIDREVEARSAAIRAICESQISAVVLQLEMQESKFSDEMLDMPLSKFLSMYCPNTEALKREDGVIELRKKVGVASKAHKDRARLNNLLPTPGNILSSTSDDFKDFFAPEFKAMGVTFTYIFGSHVVKQ